LIKSYSKDICNVTKDCISNKCCYFEISIHQRILKKMYKTVFNIDNNNECFYQIEGSCGTEDWGNDAENSALITGILYYI